MISPLLASTSLPVLIDLRSIDLFRPDIHLPINLSGNSTHAEWLHVSWKNNKIQSFFVNLNHGTVVTGI